MRQRSHPKTSQSAASSDQATRRRYTRPLNRLAEDLVNQLCVLNLIVAKIRNPMTDRSNILSEYDWQAFDGCLGEACSLGEQMAQLFEHQADKAADDISSPLKPEGQVIRMLRIVAKRNR
jgi:hypothetical protein